ncbi:MAG TPA: macro domain-containing protein [Gammaproteobacteria bacterium]
MQYAFQSIIIQLTIGDITNQPDMDAVVNAANARLMPGGGVAGAIHRAAGPGLVQECRPLAPLKPGEAVITSGQQLPNRWIIHCLGPVHGIDEPSDKLLADCYRNAIEVAERHGIERLAFPAISTGAFGYPLQDAADITANALKACLREDSSLSLIRFVLYDDSAFDAFQKAFGKAFATESTESTES